jgi:ribonucleoside-diphosphate reductase beta chain
LPRTGCFRRSQGIELVHRDESRHITFGLYFLSRLIVAHQKRAYRTFLDTMSELKSLREQSVRELMGVLGEPNPFGIQAGELAEYSQRQFATRTQKIVRARAQTMGDLNREAPERLG